MYIFNQQEQIEIFVSHGSNVEHTTK